MSVLSAKPASDCRFDLVSLGEVMLRLDPGDGRIRTARSFRAWEGGGEYNVARAFRKCFGLRAAVATAFADNEVGRLLEDCILQGGVNTDWIRWIPYDGCGRNVRNGLNFTERGFGVRGAIGVSDRGHTAASQLRPGQIDWDTLFGKLGVRCLHTGGIFAALSDTTPEVVVEAATAAKRHGTLVSYDLNYRPSLWQAIGGQEKAREVNRKIAGMVDVLFGNEEDFTACLGFEVGVKDASFKDLDTSAFRSMMEAVGKAYPNLQAVATSLREVHSATRNDWGAILWHRGDFHEATHRKDLEILDRVGGGDGFASGVLYGLLESDDTRLAVEYGAAHGALAMTTPGDTSMATLAEVKKLASGGSARVIR